MYRKQDTKVPSMYLWAGDKSAFSDKDLLELKELKCAVQLFWKTKYVGWSTCAVVQTIRTTLSASRNLCSIEIKFLFNPSKKNLPIQNSFLWFKIGFMYIIIKLFYIYHGSQMLLLACTNRELYRMGITRPSYHGTIGTSFSSLQCSMLIAR